MGMHMRPLGNSGIRVGNLALGTMTWGRTTDEYEARDQLAGFLDAGGNLIDTADVYAEGISEEMLGTLIAEFECRDNIVLATKSVSMPNTERRFNASRRHILDSLDKSLKRLGVETIDLWQLHAWDPLTPIDETLTAVDSAISAGKVRYAGISNYSGWQTAQACTLASTEMNNAIVTTQMEYSLLERGIEREIVPSAKALGIGVLPWSPLGRGVLTGKYRHSIPIDSRGAQPETSAFVNVYRDERSHRIVDALSTAAEGLGASPAEVALAWLRDRPGVVAPILGARTAQQLMLALASNELVLPDEIQTALDDVSEPILGYPEAGWAQRR
jgi:aryl-alcohol dehydrogenase-like predicted oxidoreductase